METYDNWDDFHVIETYDNWDDSHQMLYCIHCCRTVFFVFRQCALFGHVIVLFVMTIGIVHDQKLTLLDVADVTLSVV